MLEEESQQKTINYGYIVLVKCEPQVIQGLSRDAKRTASLKLPAIDSDNGQKLYIEVLDVVKSFPRRYEQFLSVLEENTFFYSDLLTVLKEAYHDIGKDFIIIDMLIIKIIILFFTDSEYNFISHIID